MKNLLLDINIMDNIVQQDLFEILSKNYSIPLTIFDEDRKVIYPIKNKISENNFINMSYFDYYTPNKITVFQKSDYLFSIFDFQDKSKRYLVFVGPWGILDLKNNSLKDGLLSIDILYSKTRQELFLDFLKLLYSLLSKSIFEDTKIDWKWREGLSKFGITLKENLDLRRYEDSALDSMELEKRYIDAICRKDVPALKWILKNINKAYFVNLSTKKINSLKYKIVALIALTTRAVINEGVSPMLAYSLSDTLIQRLDIFYSLQECVSFVKELSLLFMELLDTRPDSYSSENYLIKEIMYYINRKIYEKITLKDLAEYTAKHPSHLSATFKKHTGKTIHKYILQKRVREAKYFLLFTDKSSKDIANLLCFSTQSHFIEKFRQAEGLTPENFRKKNKAISVL